jgi:4'-phosphopantetheinyl transferase EntD
VIERILPPTAVVAEAGEEDRMAALLAEEEAMVARALERRRREFAGGRDCAHRALRLLGGPPGPVLAGRRGEPVWPAGVVGSITHTRGYRGCAVAAATDLAAIGIDAEPNEPLPERLRERVAGTEEMSDLEDLARAEPAIAWERLLFSAKEALYKAWYPLTERRLGREEAVLRIDPSGAFSVRLRVPRPTGAGPHEPELSGRWLAADGLVLTAVAIGHGPA